MHARRHKSNSRKWIEVTAPKISHTQFFVLFQLERGLKRGKVLRAALGNEKISQAVPTFHAFMGRLERDGLVMGEYVPMVGKRRGAERAYSLTAAGRRAMREVREFYRRLDSEAGE